MRRRDYSLTTSREMNKDRRGLLSSVRKSAKQWLILIPFLIEDMIVSSASERDEDYVDYQHVC